MVESVWRYSLGVFLFKLQGCVICREINRSLSIKLMWHRGVYKCVRSLWFSMNVKVKRGFERLFNYPLLQGKFGLVWWGQTIKGILELDGGKTVDRLLGKQGVAQLGLIIVIFLWYSWRCWDVIGNNLVLTRRGHYQELQIWLRCKLHAYQPTTETSLSSICPAENCGTL